MTTKHRPVISIHGPRLKEVHALIQSVGWQISDEKRAMYHNLSTTYGIESNGQLAGTIAVVKWDRYAAIGNVIVHPDHQRQGHGAQLLQHVLETLDIPARLIATDAGERLYSQHGFLHMQQVVRMVLERQVATDKAFRGGDIVPLCKVPPAVLQRLIEHDCVVAGADRERLYRALQNSTGAYLATAEPLSSLADFGECPWCLCIMEPHGVRLGPFVARSPAQAEKLIEMVMRECGQSLIMDVFEDHSDVMECLARQGFERTKRSPYMVYGDHRPLYLHPAYVAPFDAAIL